MRRTLPRLAHFSLPKAHAQVRPSPKPASYDDSAEVVPGRHVTSVCRKYNISFPNELRSIRCFKPGGNPYKMQVYISQQNCFAKKSLRYFDKAEHPLAKSMLDIYIDKKKEPLWIERLVFGGSSFPSKKAEKKIGHALREALAAAGYDRFGRRTLADSEWSAIADLYGTLRVTTTDPLAVCNAKFVDLLKYGKQIISCVEPRLRRGKDGHRLDKQHHNQHPPRHDSWRGRTHTR